MVEYTNQERAVCSGMGVGAPIAWFCAWLYSRPDFSHLLTTPLGRLTMMELLKPVLWFLLLLSCAYFAISLLYQAITARDSVWLWHPG